MGCHYFQCLNQVLVGGPYVCVKWPQKLSSKQAQMDTLAGDRHLVWYHMGDNEGIGFFFLCQDFKMFTFIGLTKDDCMFVRIQQ